MQAKFDDTPVLKPHQYRLVHQRADAQSVAEAKAVLPGMEDRTFPYISAVGASMWASALVQFTPRYSMWCSNWGAIGNGICMAMGAQMVVSCKASLRTCPITRTLATSRMDVAGCLCPARSWCPVLRGFDHQALLLNGLRKAI